MVRRTPINTTAAAHALIKGKAAGPLEPPPHVFVPAGARPFFDAIAAGRPRQDWEANRVLIATAASLALTQFRIACIQRHIDGQPDLSGNLAAIEGMVPLLPRLMALEMSYLRVLQQHGRATGGAVQVVAQRRTISAEIEAGVIARSSDPNSLLAFPTGSRID